MSTEHPPGLPPLPASCRFGPDGRFELRAAERVLLDRGTPVALGGRAFDLLLALAQRRDRVVPRGELIDAVWPGRVVEENNLSVQVNMLRRVLGTALLVTVPGRGYRFTGTLADDAPPKPAAGTGRPTHLPLAPPLLIGRSEDLAAVATLIEQHRLLTLVGPGGVGKTRLAQALLALRAESASDGVCWVALAPLAEGSSLPGAVATALGLQLPPGDAVAALGRALAGRQMLVALDNAEHRLAEVAALARALLAAAPALRLLVTSQAPLRLAEERVHRLAGLAVPQGTLPAQQAQHFGAVALFAERAQASDGRFVLGDAQVAAVVALCRALDGNALAIELAAARVALLGPERLLAAMPERLRVLTRNRDRAAPPRQQSLRAALEWSHELLDAEARRLFRRLAVVAGSAALELVQALAEVGEPVASVTEAWTVLDTLDELVQRSLVEVQLEDDGDGDAGSEPRYRLLASPQALALDLLQASGEVPAVRRRHAEALRDRLEALLDTMEAGQRSVQAWQRANERELDDARAALAWARGEAAPADAALTLGLAAGLLRALPAPLHDERRTLADLVERLEQALPADADPVLRYRAAALLSHALAAAQPQRSQAAARRALAAAAALPDDERSRWWRVQAACEAADIVASAAEADRAERMLATVATLEDPAWPPVRRRSALRVRAAIAAARGRHDEALRLDHELLRLSRAAGDPSPMTLVNIADGELRLGDARAAVRTGQALVAALHAARDDNHLVYARLNLAAAWLALDDTAAAGELRLCWPAAAQVERAGWWCDRAALLAALQGRPDDARQLIAAAESRYAARGETRQHNESEVHRRTLRLLGDAAAPPPLALADEALPLRAFGGPPAA